MNIVIGKERNEALMKKLGQDTPVYAPEQLPSLTAFLLDDPKIRHLIFLPDAQAGWSMGHILAAAQLLEHKGLHHLPFSSKSRSAPADPTGADP